MSASLFCHSFNLYLFHRESMYHVVQKVSPSVHQLPLAAVEEPHPGHPVVVVASGPEEPEGLVRVLPQEALLAPGRPLHAVPGSLCRVGAESGQEREDAGGQEARDPGGGEEGGDAPEPVHGLGGGHGGGWGWGRYAATQKHQQSQHQEDHDGLEMVVTIGR